MERAAWLWYTVQRRYDQHHDEGARRAMASSEADKIDQSIIPTSAALSNDPAFIEFAHQMLGDSELADGLSPDQLARIAATGEVRNYGEGDLICDEHERGDELYVISA